MLQIKNIKKYFNSKLVVDNLSFTVKEGSIYGLLGPNGAGKTTTLRIILGILPPSAGEVYFNNKQINSNFFNITGYLPEERGLYPKSNVKNILHYLGKLKGLSKTQVEKNTDYWLERLELSHYKKHKLEELSKGNQQKIQFISAIVHQPKILILDEPFSGFDPLNQNIFRDIIIELSKDRFVILSTHQMDLAESLCNEILLINEGKEITSGKLEDILDTKANVYSLTFAETIPKDALLKFNEINIISSEGNSLILDLNNITPPNFIKEVTALYNVSEFKKITPSLHQTFLSLMETTS